MPRVKSDSTEGMTCLGLWLLFALLPILLQQPDMSRHSVPLDEVFLDTFIPGRPPVPLSKASPQLIHRVRDGIPPLDHPRFIPVKEARFLRHDDWVLSVQIGREAKAYPIRILNLHEVINDIVGGEPILVTYCPLCRSGIVFSRRVGHRVLTFGNTSALYQSNLVLYDRQTYSWWYQVSGRAIIGALTGERLRPLASMMLTWEEWRKLYPDGFVLSPETGYSIDYDRDAYGDRYRFLLNRQRRAPYPVAQRVFLDSRLRPATRILGLEVNGRAYAYSLESRRLRVINDAIGDLAIVIFAHHGAGAAYRRQIGGRLLRFKLRMGRIIDEQTGSVWNLGGRAIDGPLAGERLEPLPVRSAYWFAWIAAFPNTHLHR